MVRQRWWSYAKSMIRDYPRLKQELDDLRSTNMIANYESTGGGRPSGHSDPVAAAATRRLDRDDQAALEAVDRAIALTRINHPKTAEARLELIKLIYWDKKYDRIQDACYEVHFSERSCRNYHKTFIYAVGFCRGLTDEIPNEQKYSPAKPNKSI